MSLIEVKHLGLCLTVWLNAIFLLFFFKFRDSKHPPRKWNHLPNGLPMRNSWNYMHFLSRPILAIIQQVIDIYLFVRVIMFPKLTTSNCIFKSNCACSQTWCTRLKRKGQMECMEWQKGKESRSSSRRIYCFCWNVAVQICLKFVQLFICKNKNRN